MRPDLRWDIFCKVIDNHGDVGVCWRLARALADTGAQVRLWVDEPGALAWMAPNGAPGVTLIPWRNGIPSTLLNTPAPDVLIEAFGCDPAPEWVTHFAQAAHIDPSTPRTWINLEYLSAEPTVERLHGLPSPVLQGPGAGLTKYFFYPGFTAATGGLLREPELASRHAAFDRADWLRSQGIDWQGERLVTLFCYEPAALPELVAQLRQSAPPSRLLITPGRAAGAMRALPPAETGAALALSWLPYLPQPEFDHLLWASDLNFVRGEDSLVRALWAGMPLVWQIYPQHDDAHHAKLDAFLDWLQAPESLRALHYTWNGLSNAPLQLPDGPTLDVWRQTVQMARVRLLEQDDLLTRLRHFVTQKS